MTIAAACRLLEIDRNTFLKWHALGLVQLVTIGPKGHEIRRVPVAEVQRLQAAS